MADTPEKDPAEPAVETIVEPVAQQAAEQAAAPSEEQKTGPTAETEIPPSREAGRDDDAARTAGGPDLGKDGPGNTADEAKGASAGGSTDGGPKDAGAKGPGGKDANGREAGSKDPHAKGANQRDDLTDEDRRASMDLFAKSLDKVDWEWKQKTGVERDIGHKSAMVMERAFIHAASGDREGASRLYEEKAGKPPSAQLMQRVDALNRIDFTKGIDSLTDAISNIDKTRDKQRDHSKLHQHKETIERKVKDWSRDLKTVKGDAHKHGKQALDAMLENDQHDPKQNGLFLLKHLRKGMGSGSDLMKSARLHVEHYKLHKRVKTHTRQHGEVVKEIAGFSTEQNQDGSPVTVGRNGQISKQFGGIRNIVERAFGAGRKAPGAERTTPEQEAGVKRQAGPSMAAAQAASRGAGMGG